MQRSPTIFVLFIICAAVLCAGCTQPVSLAPGTPVPVTGTATALDPGPLGLASADLPQGSILVESRTKNTSEMTRLALDLGWQGGQVVRYVLPAHEEKGTYEIIHSIAMYPEAAVPDVIGYSERAARSDPGFTYTDFAVNGIGNNARAFSGIAAVQPVQKPVSNPIIAGPDTEETTAGIKTNFSEIIFSRGKTFEVIKITGPSPDTAMLIDLSRKAYAKIP
jgi:hypothetical protein